MPRVTDAYRQLRRDEIAEAALRVLERHGPADASIAQIVEESGLSTGAIYGNFANKAALSRYVATRLLAWRTEHLDAVADRGDYVTPIEAMRLVLTAVPDQRQVPALLHFWSEALVDADLRTAMTAQVGALAESLGKVLGPWAEHRDDADSALAGRTARTCVIACQGYFANRALYGWLEVEEYLSALVGVSEGAERASAGGGKVLADGSGLAGDHPEQAGQLERDAHEVEPGS